MEKNMKTVGVIGRGYRNCVGIMGYILVRVEIPEIRQAFWLMKVFASFRAPNGRA